MSVRVCCWLLKFYYAVPYSCAYVVETESASIDFDGFCQFLIKIWKKGVRVCILNEYNMDG